MHRRLRRLSFVFVIIAAASARLGAQTTGALPPAGWVGCYAIALDPWSRSLGVNAAYHAVPSTIFLDSMPAARGGWRVSPDIQYPGNGSFPGLPRWRVANDTAEVSWSNGFQPTTLRLVRHDSGELRGDAVVRSDANEFGEQLPRAAVIARRIACVPR